MHVYNELYPPGPATISGVIPMTGYRYKLHAVGMLVAFAVFIGIYLGVIGGAVYALYWLINHAFALDSTALMRVVFIVLAMLMAVSLGLLLKALLKRQPVDISRFIELSEEQEPKLFAFLQQLCRDTNAPMPRRVFLCPNVNAGVFYDTSVPGVLWSHQKNLLIGLGLINSLNLSEFKAVLAHEFGHFSQKSMRLNNYVFFANHVLKDIAQSRSRWERYLLAVCDQGGVWAPLASILAGGTWLVRRTMSAGLYIMNVLDSSLSKQMEIQADRVAIQVAGSDAIIQALAKTEYADRCFMQTLQDLRHAARHGLRTQDIFYHHERALQLWQHLKNATPSEESLQHLQSQWPMIMDASSHGLETHPSTAERETSARRYNFKSPIDERSPWLLFESPDALRREMTDLLIDEVCQSDNAQDYQVMAPEDVQQFLDREHAEVVLNAKYHAVYEKRYIEISGLKKLIQRLEENIPDRDQLAASYQGLYGSHLEDAMKRFRIRVEEMNRLAKIIQTPKRWQRKFVFRNAKYRIDEAPGLYQELAARMQDEREWFEDFDKNVFATHYYMARDLDNDSLEELKERYDFHLHLQHCVRHLRSMNQSIEQLAAEFGEYILNVHDEHDSNLQEMAYALEYVMRLYGRQLEILSDMKVPALNNIAHRSRLSNIVPIALPEPGNVWGDISLNRSWFESFRAESKILLDHLSWIRRKSLGGILATQEEIAENWRQSSN